MVGEHVPPPAAKPLSHYEGAEQGYVLGAGDVATGWHGILARSRPAWSRSIRLIPPLTSKRSLNAPMSTCLPTNSKALLAAAALNVKSKFPESSFNWRRLFG